VSRAIRAFFDTSAWFASRSEDPTLERARRDGQDCVDGDGAEVRPASDEFRTATYETFAQMRAEDPVLCQPGVDGETMLWFVTRYDDVASSMVALLIIAGHETTVSLIGNAVLVLLQHPDQRAELEHDPNKHLALGRGSHYCLGAPLARLEAEIALTTLFRRLPGLRLAVPVDELSWRPVPLFRSSCRCRSPGSALRPSADQILEAEPALDELDELFERNRLDDSPHGRHQEAWNVAAAVGLVDGAQEPGTKRRLDRVLIPAP
jgi:hypothetical protein